MSASHGIPDAEPAWSDNWTHGAGTLHLEIILQEDIPDAYNRALVDWLTTQIGR